MLFLIYWGRLDCTLLGCAKCLIFIHKFELNAHICEMQGPAGLLVVKVVQLNISHHVRNCKSCLLIVAKICCILRKNRIYVATAFVYFKMMVHGSQ